MAKFFGKKKEPKDTSEILKEFNNLKKEFDSVSKELKDLKEKSNLHLQKIGMIRYNPFSNVGGDQSFSVALLDKKNNGIVITSLYAEGGNRVYGKIIENAQSQHSLSQEELKAIKKAIG